MAGELPAGDGPVVLCFGLLRPYKGLDVLLEALGGGELDGARELWIVGHARAWTSPRCARPRRRACASSPRFVRDAELPAYFRRADLVVLPYREIDQSGVLFTALAFGKPLLLSDVGGFPEVAATGAARTVPAGDAARAARGAARAARPTLPPWRGWPSAPARPRRGRTRGRRSAAARSSCTAALLDRV